MAASPPSPPTAGELPISIRVALDLIALAAFPPGKLRPPQAIGRDRLLKELARYAPLGTDGDALVAIGADPQDVRAVVTERQPEHVFVVVDGPLGRVVQARAPASTPMSALEGRAWRDLGFELSESVGVQGVGALGWAVGEQLARRVHRPDLADRCRIAMLRSMLVPRRRLGPATLRVQTYRRKR